MRLLEWRESQVAHPEYVMCFAWVAKSRVMPIEYRLVRTPGHRYHVWIMGPGEGMEEMKARKEGEVTPMLLTVVGSAPKGKGLCQQLDRLLMKVLRSERESRRKGGP
jgi:hypothetical protein